ncbi:MAG: sigma 54-interacting transcriptional regulator [Sandaracinaceae bacterium]|nr:sigma 54-interacting transcriptional regulator [Sandaracinaceae bacterium]
MAPAVHGTPCVGREAELLTLASLYSEARTEGERVAWLEGQSGVGKSRLLQEFRGRVRLDGGIVLDGRCEPGRAFGPFEEIVTQALRFLDEVNAAPSIDVADLACRAGCHRFWHQHRHDAAESETLRFPVNAAPVNAVEAQAEAVERRIRFFEAIRELLVDVARVRPPVVILHDLERADQGTLQLLAFLLEGVGPLAYSTGPENVLHALIIGSVRNDGVADSSLLHTLLAHPASTRVEVGKLTADGVRALLQAPETVARVLMRTGGLPEAIDLLLDGDPLTPEARIQRRVESLLPAARRLVEALAVVRRPSDLDLLARVAGTEIDSAARNDFGRSELVLRTIVEGRILFSFAREADRERAYAMLDDARRRELHLLCMVALTDDSQEATEHALASGEVARAVPLAIDAASMLAARHAHGEAAELLERVVAASAGEIPTQLREQLAELYRVSAEYPRALEHARVLAAQASSDANAAKRVGELLTLSGEFDEAANVLTSAHRMAHEANDALATAEVDALLAELFWQRASYGEALKWAELALADAAELGVLHLTLHARNTLGKVALAQRDAGAAASLFEQNRVQAQNAGMRHQEAQALTNLGVAMLRRQELASAETYFARAAEVAREAADTRDCAIATENLAVLAHIRQHYATAQSYYHEAVAALKRLGNRAMLARVANNLGELYLTLGDRSRAATLCEFAAHVGGPALPPSVVGEGLLLRGRIEAANGHDGAARAAFEAASATFQRHGMRRLVEARLELTHSALSEGDVKGAERILASLGENESPRLLAQIAVLRVDVARAAGDDTLDIAGQALAVAESAGDDDLRLEAQIRMARASIDAGNLSEASRAVALARVTEDRLTTQVPEDALETWQARRTRQELAQIEGLVSSSFGRESGVRRGAQRTSVAPPPRATSQRSDDWHFKYPEIVGNSVAIQSVLSVIDRAAPSDCLVLVRGESGTGKELVAEALHNQSPRRDKPLIKVNCAALVETLLLSELFGHERGAFTGATARKKGRFELADGGTLFLDEIGDISPKTQVALLRVLQEREFERVGGTQPIKVDVRIICATHRDLEKMVRSGEFREDLYYRLRGVMIEMPALRSRIEDLPIVTDRLLLRIATERNESPKTLSNEALRLLSAHRWSGNVRELDNVLRSATLFSDGQLLDAADFAAFAPSFVTADPEPEVAHRNSINPEPAAVGPEESEIELAYKKIRGGAVSLFDMKKEIERECISRALLETNGNITKAATLLGMKRPRLSQLVKQYGLQANGEA